MNAKQLESFGTSLKKYILFLVAISGLFFNISVYSLDSTAFGEKKSLNEVQSRYVQEKKQFDNAFTLSLHEPNYVLPTVYSSSHNQIYIENNPEKNNLNHVELNFKFSVKVPVLKNILLEDNTLYVAYTQLSYWQAYRQSSFFRNSDYKPEIFLAHNLNLPLWRDWKFQIVDIGLTHESNGYGVPLERNWNRIYLEGVLSKQNWMISIRPWYAMPGKSFNTNITHYLGNGRLVVAYNYNNKVFSGETYNLEHGLGLTTVRLSWSFPLTKKTKGYVQFFHGYGQSLIDYNYRNNSLGIGIAFSDWIL